MTKRTTAIISYFPVFGWLISFFVYQTRENSRFIAYHLKQSLGLFATFCLFGIFFLLLTNVPHVDFIAELICYLLLFVFLIFMTIGIFNASDYQLTSLPLIGKFFKNRFNFIRK